MTEAVHESPTPSASLRPLRRVWVAALFVAAITATAFVTPMFFHGNVSGHDFQPHVASWVEAAGQWREGILLPRWATGANSGFGEPRFIFYPPASWMVGAALGLILPWRMVPGVFIWLAIFSAALSMWKFARELLLPKQALAAAMIFAANPYHFAIVYYRSAFAELLASALFPLLLCGALGILRHGWRRVPLLSIAIAGIWLSNAPAGVVATYSLALILVVACIVGRSIRALILGSVGLVVGLGLAAFYLVSAWWEQPWVQIAQTVSASYEPARNFLFTRINDLDFIQFNWKISALAVSAIVLTIPGIILSFRRRRESEANWWPLVALFLGSVFLMLPPSAFLWRHLPELKFLQFPWRWLLPLNFAFAFFAATVRGRHKWLWLLMLICALWTTGATVVADTSWDSDDLSTTVADVAAGRGYDGIEGFEPRGAKTDELDEENPRVGEIDPETGDINEPEAAQVKIQSWSTEYKAFDAKSDEPLTLALKLLNYPAWQVRVDGQVTLAESAIETGQIVIHLNRGAHRVEIQFQRTRDRTIGAIISAVFAVGLLLAVGLGFARERRKKAAPND